MWRWCRWFILECHYYFCNIQVILYLVIQAVWQTSRTATFEYKLMINCALQSVGHDCQNADLCIKLQDCNLYHFLFTWFCFRHRDLVWKSWTALIVVLTMKHGSVMDILMPLQDSYARYLISDKHFTRIQQVWKMLEMTFLANEYMKDHIFELRRKI